jgi:hypothetical protein
MINQIYLHVSVFSLMIFFYLYNFIKCKIEIFRFFSNYFIYLSLFLIYFSISYLKFVKRVFGHFKLMFFVSFIPVFIQANFTFFFFIDSVWNIYLFSIIVITLYLSLPCYIFNCIRKQSIINYDRKFLKSLSFCILVFTSLLIGEIFIGILLIFIMTLLYVFASYKLKKK